MNLVGCTEQQGVSAFGAAAFRESRSSAQTYRTGAWEGLPVDFSKTPLGRGLVAHLHEAVTQRAPAGGSTLGSEPSMAEQSHPRSRLPRHLVAYDPHADRLLAHGGKGSSDELLVHVGLQLCYTDFQR